MKQNWKKERKEKKREYCVGNIVPVLHSVQLPSHGHYVPQYSMEETKSAYEHIATSYNNQ